ncbi:glycosyltransferase family 4 protein [Xanthobacter dioxanivorans]|uniref:Glycosyltransferase family 4 protein n=1 Tax=Xanthobacter dioxanivorans TaxID=2528964 RepID=A0A974PMV8_9HYPH|nr:glycosyltransferase family 4 protein [Xanthobacter dioxanivorans]QRG05900.1 glycosyltransferase family 4 protein [Xanthobacter dioxanivorans]
MKILILTPHYPPRQGGTSDYVARLCLELKERGHKVTVITRDGAPIYDAVKVSVLNGPWSLWSLKSLVNEISLERPDAILLQYGPYSFNRRGPGIPVVSLVIMASVITKIPFVVYAHELYANWNHSYLRAPWHFAQRIAVVLMIFFSKRFVLTIESRRRRLLHFLPWWRKRLDVISVAPTLDREVIDANWRASRGIGENTALLSAMGTDDPEKGARLLGQIADALAARKIDFRFVTIGGLRPNHPRIESWGYVSAHDAWNLVATSDLFVLPYDDGVSGRRTSALNALAAGTAILTTYGVNTDDTLFPRGSIAMVPAGQPMELAKTAVEIFSDSSVRKALRSVSLHLSEQFSWHKHVMYWETILRECIDNGTGDR